jgi:peroxiredoxin Q/BCP
MPLQAGQPAPRFRREAHDGTQVTVADGALPKVLVLYFYPKDETPGCTVEACGFRDAYVDFVDAGATVVGVSGDSLASHRAFARNHDLPFLLISDADGSLRRAFGVGRTLGLLPGRVTFVIDREGVIRHVFDSQIRARRHVAEAMRVVKQLAVG